MVRKIKDFSTKKAVNAMNSDERDMKQHSKRISSRIKQRGAV